MSGAERAPRRTSSGGTRPSPSGAARFAAPAPPRARSGPWRMS